MNINSIKEMVFKEHSEDFINYLKKDTQTLLSKGRARKEINNADELIEYQKQTKLLMQKSFAGIEDVKFIESELTGTIEFDTYKIEKVLIKGEGNIYLTTNIYIPKDNKIKHAAVMFVCGHSIEAKAYEEYQIVLQNIVKGGLIAFAVDPMGQGERLNYYNPETGKNDVEGTTAEHSYNGNKCWISGIPISHFFIRDMKLALSYLVLRDDVDSDKIGLTGNSGGGTQTSMMMLCQDERIKAFAPATYITSFEKIVETFQPQDDEQNFLNLEYGFDYDDIILSVAPKPVNILAVYNDFFPIDGTLDTYNKVKKIYQKLSVAQNIEITIDNSNHMYTDALAKSAAKFFAKHLNGELNLKLDYNYNILEKCALNVTKTGQLKTSGYNIKFLSQELEEIADNFNKDLPDKNLLKDIIFKNRAMVDSKLNKIAETQIDNVFISFYEIESCYGLKNIISLLRKSDDYDKIKVLFFDDGNSHLVDNFENIKKFIDDKCAVIIADTSNFGFLKPKQLDSYGVYDRFGILYTFSHHMFMRGDSFAALRCFEIINAINIINKNFHCETEYYAEGNIENLVSLCMFYLEKKCFYSDNSFDYEKIVKSYLYNDDNIKPYIINGILNICDIQLVKNNTKAGIHCESKSI